MHTLWLPARLGALVLLVSLLPLAVQAPVPVGAGMEARPAAWLSAQVQSAANTASSDTASSQRRDAQRAFERAMAEAQAADAATLHGFLTAFLNAHARLTNAEAVPTEGRSCRALIQALRKQLARTGLVVHPAAQVSAPPASPLRLGRWAAASLLGSLPGRAGLLERAAHVRSRLHLLFADELQRAVAPVAGGGLIRVLFTGRLLGP